MLQFLENVDPILYYLGVAGIIKHAVLYRMKDTMPKDAKLVGHIKSLWLYPLKSASPIQVKDVECTSARGPTHGPLADRHWMVTKSNFDMVTPRQDPRVSMIRERADGAKIILSAEGLEDLVLDPEAVEKRQQVVDTAVHTVPAKGLDAGEQAAGWISQFFKSPGGYRIVYCGSALYQRGVIGGNKKYVDWTKMAKPEDKIAFHDSTAIHLCTEESLADLNSRLPSPIDILRFRPNFVVSATGAAPYDEDNWKHLYIGNVRLRTIKVCCRCVVPTVDPETGIQSEEPLHTLNTYRAFLKGLGPCFGIDLIVERSGTIKDGDAIYVVRGDNLSKP